MTNTETATTRALLLVPIGMLPVRTRRGSHRAVVIARWLVLLALMCVIPVGATGFKDETGSGTIIVTKNADLDSGPRGLEVSLRTPDWTAIHASGQSAVVIGDAGSIWHSADGGKTWTSVQSGTDSGLRALHGDGQRLVAVGIEGAIVRSADGGKTWTPVQSGTDSWLYALHGDGQRLVAVGSGGAIVRSADGGKTWTSVQSGTDSGLNALHGDGQRLVAVGSGGAIVRSADGGKTWTPVQSGTDSRLRALHGDGQRLVAVGRGGAIVRSADGGKTWTPVQSGTGSDLNALHGDGQRLVAVGSGGAIVRLADGGKTWTPVQSGTGSDLNALHGDGQRLVAVGIEGAIVRSADGGKTWTPVQSDAGSRLSALHGDGQRLVAVGRGGAIVRSADGGKTWTSVQSGTGSWLSALHGDGQRLVAVGFEGAIVLVTPTGPRLPLLNRIDYVPELSSGELELRFEIHDSDAQCIAGWCRLEVLGGNKTDINHRRPFNALKQQPKRDGEMTTWRTTVDPKSEYNIRPGEHLYLDVRLSGPSFSMRYPLDDQSLRVGYFVDYTAYYIGAAVLGVAVALLLVFWVRPLWMLSIYRRAGLFELASKIPVPGVADVVKILGNLLLIPWLTCHPRVLDAWLARHRQRWEALFRCEEAVERLRYYPLPLRRPASDERIKSPAPMHFCGDFATRRTLLQILGPGGSGKSSFAAQLGNWSLEGQLIDHPMLPVWLDEDIADLDVWMVSRVRQVSADDDLPETFIQALYRRKRLLLVVDRLSEKQAETQKAIRHPPGYLNAMVVTSRTEQNFGLPDVKIIEAAPLGSENLMGFVNDLLESRVDGDEAFRGFKNQVDLAQRLADVITIGQQELPVTPLLVRLFVERALEQAKRSGKPDLDDLPQSVPEVYFDYLRSVNPDDPSAANYLPDDVMMEAAKLIARVELGDDFRPKRIEKPQLQAALQQAGLGGASDPLQRLLDNQVLEAKDIGGSTLVAFALDPIAEYVAAFAHAQDCGRDGGRWNDLRANLAERGLDAAGFSEALRVTHEVFSQEFGWP